MCESHLSSEMRYKGTFRALSRRDEKMIISRLFELPDRYSYMPFQRVAPRCWSERRLMESMTLTIRWTSKYGSGPRSFRSDSTSGWPNVRFGTKCPSITSRCSQSAPRNRHFSGVRCDVSGRRISSPAANSFRHSEARLARSELRIDGHMNGRRTISRASNCVYRI